MAEMLSFDWLADPTAWLGLATLIEMLDRRVRSGHELANDPAVKAAYLGGDV